MAGRDRPGLRELADQAAEHDHDAAPDHDRADPVPGPEPGDPAPARRARQRVQAGGEDEDDGQHAELAAHEAAQERRNRREADPQDGFPHERRREQQEGERRVRIAERLLEDHRRVGERRHRRRAGGGEQRRPRRYDRAREQVGGDDRESHGHDADVLHDRIGQRGRLHRPGRRDQPGVEGLPEVRIAAARAVTGRLDGTGDLRQLELVGEQPRRGVARRLPGVKRQQRHEQRGERDGAVEPVEPHATVIRGRRDR